MVRGAEGEGAQWADRRVGSRGLGRWAQAECVPLSPPGGHFRGQTGDIEGVVDEPQDV